MKKILAIAVALLMMMTAALAEEAVELNWEDVEPVLEAAGVDGDFYTFDDVNIEMWIPEGLESVELSDADVEKGYIGYFMPEDQSAVVAVMYVDVNGMSLEEYADYLSNNADVDEVDMGVVNGFACVSYKMPAQDSVSIAFTTEAGYVLEVTCTPASEENAELVWGAVFSSIQAAA
ncbi:MAG: hypothetical protein IJJ45_11580 [Clostridia bacterium]|nr:hypothetical protein [Clostridia bacterium]